MVSLPTAPVAAETIERHIRNRTFGQVRDLRVVIEGRSVVLQGRVETYYAKQLAQHAALDAVAGGDLINEIAVVSLSSRSAAPLRP